MNKPKAIRLLEKITLILGIGFMACLGFLVFILIDDVVHESVRSARFYLVWTCLSAGTFGALVGICMFITIIKKR